MAADFRDLRVSWVHPSVRDLVIQHLRDHESERHQFLATTGVYGALLALSRGGGQKGTLSMPLLLNDKDWETLAERLVGLAMTQSANSLSTLLSSMFTSLGPANSLNHDRVTALMHATLNGVRDNWILRQDRTGDSNLLKNYYLMAQRTGIWLPSPDLNPTWRYELAQVIECLENESEPSDKVAGLHDFFEFVELLLQNEPRFLVFAKFSEHLKRLYLDILDCLELALAEIPEVDEQEDVEIRDSMGRLVSSQPIDPDWDERGEEAVLASLESVLQFLSSRPMGHAKAILEIEGKVTALHAVYLSRQSRYEEWEEERDASESDELSFNDQADSHSDWIPSGEVEGLFSDL